MVYHGAGNLIGSPHHRPRGPLTRVIWTRNRLSPGCRAVELSRLRRGAVEALSRRCQGTVEALSRPCLSSLSSSCRAPVEPVEADSICLSVEVCRAGRVSVEFLCRGCRVYCQVCCESRLRLACSFAILHEAFFFPRACKNMVMSRQLRTAAASLTTTADSSARCHMPNHAHDPLIDHPAPLMAWRAATATAAPPHRR